MKRRKLTHREYILKLKNIGSRFIPMERYQGANTKILHYCPKCNVMWKVRPSNICFGWECPECNRRTKWKKLTHDEYLQKLKSRNIVNIVPLEEYKGMMTKIKHKCLVHDYIWEATPQDVLNKKKCPECGSTNRDSSKRESYKNYPERLKQVNPNVIPLEECKNLSTKILHRCLVCGLEWKIIPRSLLNGTHCPNCSNISRRKPHSQFIQEMSSINPDIEILEKYAGARKKIKCKCKICEKEWFAKPNDLLSGHGCPHCKSSRGEQEVRKWLTDHKIKFEEQKTFKGLKNKYLLRFDFYVPKFNTCIEYDGAHHFQPVDYRRNDNGESASSAFEYALMRDEIKNNYCKEHDINLIRIPYYENVDEILNKSLNIQQNT